MLPICYQILLNLLIKESLAQQEKAIHDQTSKGGSVSFSSLGVIMKLIKKLSLLALALLSPFCFSTSKESPKKIERINDHFPTQYRFYIGTIGNIRILSFSPDKKTFTFASEDHDPGAIFWGKVENLVQTKDRMRKKK